MLVAVFLCPAFSPDIALLSDSLCLGDRGCFVFSSWLFCWNPLCSSAVTVLEQSTQCLWKTVTTQSPQSDCFPETESIFPRFSLYFPSSSLKQWLAILLLLGFHTFKISWSFEKCLYTAYKGKYEVFYWLMRRLVSYQKTFREYFNSGWNGVTESCELFNVWFSGGGDLIAKLCPTLWLHGL